MATWLINGNDDDDNNDNDDVDVSNSSEDKERARRQQLRRLKMKFGLTVSKSSDDIQFLCIESLMQSACSNSAFYSFVPLCS